ncbi:hypothetical protein E1211_15380 [Micromonospora sp. 15K316]|uniref:hypothetical protein n=1 Tax=unclassified Micromonospora TaxID=2617518 RepID=UPI0010474923|nr:MULTISPECIES: hypothetical protein [unclassified Micromonospora]TDB71811.1 hypothetical protein E1165_22045 [Micromonospora sp. KC723]TDC35685.1 hypothetical protein E1211_15380 [Micromonospora sp. 15K316]
MSQESTRPEVTRVPAGQLERGQHIISRSIVAEVAYVLPYRDGDGHPTVAVMVNPVGAGEPFGDRLYADVLVRLATEGEVAAAVEGAHRVQLVAGLRELADLIEQHELRFRSWYGIDVNAVLPEGEVSRVSELLGVELTWSGSEQRQVQLKLRQPERGEGVSVIFRGLPAKAWTCPYCPFTAADADAGAAHIAAREAGTGCVTGPATAAQAGE